MLIKDFYQQEATEQIAENEWQVGIQLNAEHEIYQGHFPGQPVVPGVCQLQIIKELSEHIMERELALVKASYIKFTAVIDPLVNSRVAASIVMKHSAPDEVTVTGNISAGETIFLKSKCQYKIS